MSLINDVLRQVDSRGGIKDEVSSFLPVGLIPKNNRNTSRLFFMIMSGFLVLIYIFQLIMNKPLFNNVAASIEPSIIELALPEPRSTPRAVMVSSVSNEDSHKVLEPVHISEQLVVHAKPMQKQPAESLTAEPSSSSTNTPEREIPKVKSAKTIKPKITLPKVDTSIVIKAQDEPEGEQEYQRALSYFISGNIERSDYMIKQALLKNSSEEYLSLQARVFIKQNDADSFYRLVKTYPENNSLDWYKLIAPGLQLFSYYHLSNQYYYALIKIEPEQIRWQLAVALNQLRLGKEDKAIAIYRELSQSAQVSGQQKQWLIRKIERLTLSKA